MQSGVEGEEEGELEQDEDGKAGDAGPGEGGDEGDEGGQKGEGVKETVVEEWIDEDDERDEAGADKGGDTADEALGAEGLEVLGEVNFHVGREDDEAEGNAEGAELKGKWPQGGRVGA